MMRWSLSVGLFLLQGSVRADLLKPLTFTCNAQDGTRIVASWFSAGTGTVRPLVVQMPGFAQRRGTRSMALVTSLLTPTADVLFLDPRGMGQSDGRYTFGAEEGRDLVAALGAIKQRYTKTVLLGFSLGSYICLRAATEGGLRPDRLLLVSVPTQVEEIVSSGGAFLNPLAMLFQKHHYVIEHENDIFFRWGPIFIDKPSAADLAPGLRCPTHFLVGGRDKLVFNELSRAVYDATPQPKTWELWPDGLHAEAMVLQYPEKFQAWFNQAIQ